MNFVDDSYSQNVQGIIDRYQNINPKTKHYYEIETWRNIVTLLDLQTVAVFFAKISGNGVQAFLASDHPTPFSGNKVFLLSCCESPNIGKDAVTIVRTLMDFGFGEEIQDKYKVTYIISTTVTFIILFIIIEKTKYFLTGFHPQNI